MSLQKNLIVLLASCVTLALANNNQQFFNDAPAGLSLLTFLSSSNEALRNNPQQSMKCFEFYMPLINEIAQTYENDFKACMAASEAAQSAAENATANERAELAQTIEASCSALRNCTETESASDIYTCYINKGSEGAKSLYGVSNEATLQLAALQESKRRIQSEESVCTTETKVQYETQSAQAYADLNSCMMGTPVPTTTVAPTTVATTEEATTEEATTTEATTTDATTTEVTTDEATTEEATTTEATTTDATTTEVTTTEVTTTEAITTEATTEESVPQETTTASDDE